MIDLRTHYLGLPLRSPLVASPSPATSTLRGLRQLDQAGVGAVVLPSVFEEDVEAESMHLFDRQLEGSGSHPEAADYFPHVRFDHLSLDRHMTLLQEAVALVSVPVIASINGRTLGGWTAYARDMEDAGAAAIELNMYDVASDPARTGAEVEAGYLALVESVCDSVSVPVAVKVSPYFSSFANFAARLVDAGARGLILFNRFYQPDLDLQTLDVTPVLDLSHPADLRLPLRWTAILRPQLPTASLALTSGVASGTDVAKGLLAGADVVMVAAEILRRGPDRAADMLNELTDWMRESEYASVEQLKGSVAQHSAVDSGAYERAQYQAVLASWRK